MPDLAIVLPKALLQINHMNNILSVMILNGFQDDLTDHIKATIRESMLDSASNIVELPMPDAIPVKLTVSSDAYMQHVLICKEHILAGDIYQIQLGHEVLVTPTNLLS